MPEFIQPLSGASRPKRRRGLHVVPGRKGAFVKAPDGGVVSWVDDFTAELLERCDGRRSLYAISEHLAGGSDTRWFRGVERATTALLRTGFLELRPPRRVRRKPTATDPDLRLRLFDDDLTVAAHCREFLAHARRRLGLLELRSGRRRPLAATFELQSVGSAYRLVRDGVPVDFAGSPLDASRGLEREVFHCLVARHSGQLWIHAGAASATRDAAAVLLAGPSGRGKSSIVSALCRDHDWWYISDEAIAHDRAGGTVRGFAHTPAERYQPVDGAPPVSSGKNLPKRAVSIPSNRVRRDRAPVGVLVFPLYAPGEAPRITRLQPRVGVLDLGESVLNLSSREHFESMVELAYSVPAYRLRFEDPRLAAAAVAEAARCKWAGVGES